MPPSSFLAPIALTSLLPEISTSLLPMCVALTFLSPYQITLSHFQIRSEEESTRRWRRARNVRIQSASPKSLICSEAKKVKVAKEQEKKKSEAQAHKEELAQLKESQKEFFEFLQVLFSLWGWFSSVLLFPFLLFMHLIHLFLTSNRKNRRNFWNSRQTLTKMIFPQVIFFIHFFSDFFRWRREWWGWWWEGCDEGGRNVRWWRRWQW